MQPTKPRKIAATITDTNGTEQRLYAQETEDGMVALWTKNTNLGLYRTERFGDRLGRDWIRNLLTNSPYQARF